MFTTSIQIALVITTSTIAAITGVLNILWKFRDRRPNVRLHVGPKEFSIDPWSALYLVNHGSSPVRIADYGLLLMDGTLFSIPVKHETGYSGPVYRKGDTVVPPQKDFEAGVDINGRWAGVYCRLYDDKRTRITFCNSVSLRYRLLLRLKVFFQ